MNEKIPRDLHAELLAILDEAMQVDQAARGKIRVYNPESGRLEILAQRGFSDDFVESFAAVTREDGVPCARAFRSRRRVTVPDVARDVLPPGYRAAAAREGSQAMQSTPLVGTGGRVIGTLTTHFPQVHLPSMAAALVLDYLSRKAAGAIEASAGPRLT